MPVSSQGSVNVVIRPMETLQEQLLLVQIALLTINPVLISIATALSNLQGSDSGSETGGSSGCTSKHLPCGSSALCYSRVNTYFEVQIAEEKSTKG